MVLDAMRWRKTYYIAFIMLFFIFIIVFAIVVITIPKVKYCENSEGKCGGYINNLSCETSLQTNGGTNCLTKCDTFNRTFICTCPSNSIWVQKELACVLKCEDLEGKCENDINNKACIAMTPTNGGSNCLTKCDLLKRTFICTCPYNKIWVEEKLSCILQCQKNISNTDCVNYHDGEYCLKSSEVYNGTNCTSICNANNGSDFICFCYNSFWNPIHHFCQLCPLGYTLLYKYNSCFAKASDNDMSIQNALSICNGTRIHLPIITSQNMLDDLTQFAWQNNIIFSWLSFQYINTVWYWRADCYDYLIPVTTFFGEKSEFAYIRIYFTEWQSTFSTDKNQAVCQYDLP